MKRPVQVCCQLASCQQTCVTFTIAVCTVKNPDDGQRNFTKRAEFYSKNKFEKLVHLVGFISRTTSVICNSRCSAVYTVGKLKV